MDETLVIFEGVSNTFVLRPGWVEGTDKAWHCKKVAHLIYLLIELVSLLLESFLHLILDHEACPVLKKDLCLARISRDIVMKVILQFFVELQS